MSELNLPTHREHLKTVLEEALKRNLLRAFPDSNRSHAHATDDCGNVTEKSGGEGGSLSDALKKLFSAGTVEGSTLNTNRQ